MIDNIQNSTPVEALQRRLDGLEAALRAAGLTIPPDALRASEKPLSLLALREHALAGFRNPEIAAHFGMSLKEFNKALKQNSKARSLLHFGRSAFETKIQQRLSKNAIELEDTETCLALAKRFGMLQPNEDYLNYLLPGSH